MILAIQDLCVAVEEKEVLQNVSLEVKAGEVHLLMGSNGAGKSTLAKALMGHPSCTVTSGTISFCGDDLLKLSPHERVGKGLFMSFQNPVEIPGVNCFKFLLLSTNSVRKMRGEEPYSKATFEKELQEKLDLVGFPRSFLERNVHEGYSGGEKKRLEMLLMALLKPTLAIVDEIDSGLDVDAIKQVGSALRTIMQEGALLIITHNPRFIDHFSPTQVHILSDGKKIVSREGSFISHIEEKGLEALRREQ
jgi:Fe-S cluster assembly ATP-binding protein